jgi:hypothetical protein
MSNIFYNVVSSRRSLFRVEILMIYSVTDENENFYIQRKERIFVKPDDSGIMDRKKGRGDGLSHCNLING